MLPSEAGILQTIASSIVDPVTYIALSLLFAFILYIAIGILWDIPHAYKLTLSLILPFVILEFILTAIFGFFGMHLDWGTYTYSFPFGKYELTSFVMGSKFLGYVFDFGFFTSIGQAYFTEFAKNIPAMLPEPGLFFKAFVAFYVSIDSIIDFIFFYFFFMALIVIFDDLFNGDDTIGTIVAGVVALAIGYVLYSIVSVDLYNVVIFSGAVFAILFLIFKANIRNASMYSVGLSLIPLGLYNWFISNPFTEYATAMPQLQKVFYFWQHADNWSLMVYFGTLILSFLLVMQILAAIIDSLYRLGSSTISPGLQGSMWAQNYQGIAFGYTLAFAIMYALHEYSWYVFFPFLTFYIVFKKMSGGLMETAKVRGEKLELQQVNNSSAPRERHDNTERRTGGVMDTRDGIDIGTILIVMSVVGLVVLYFMM